MTACTTKPRKRAKYRFTSRESAERAEQIARKQAHRNWQAAAYLAGYQKFSGLALESGVLKATIVLGEYGPLALILTGNGSSPSIEDPQEWCEEIIAAYATCHPANQEERDLQHLAHMVRKACQ